MHTDSHTHPYTNPTPKLTHHKKKIQNFYIQTKTSLMISIYKVFSSWDILSHGHTHTHTHTHSDVTVNHNPICFLAFMCHFLFLFAPIPTMVRLSEACLVPNLFCSSRV